MNPLIKAHLQRHEEASSRLQESHLEDIARLGAAWVDTLKAGGKILFCGNGGSAADSQHLAAELVVRFRRERQGLAGLALTTDTSVLTAGGNDYGYDSIFARQVQALGREGDLLVGISTSGGSGNVVAAMTAAKEAGIRTMAWCGSKGGLIADMADLVFAAPSEETARIQECHLLVGHILCDLVDDEFAG